MRPPASLVLMLGLALTASPAAAVEPINWFLTLDQQGDRLLRAGRFADAAGRYADPFRQGTAWYRAGEFARAAEAFAVAADRRAGAIKVVLEP